MSAPSRSNSSSERSAIRTFSSSANCVRIPPAALLVEPAASVSRSSSTTSPAPSRRRWYTVAAPRAPPPITTTSARVLADASEELSERLEVAGRSACPLDHDLLLDREVVPQGRLELNARIDERVLPRVERVQRPHQARPRRVLARVLQGVDERPGDAEAVDDVGVSPGEARGQ